MDMVLVCYTFENVLLSCHKSTKGAHTFAKSMQNTEPKIFSERIGFPATTFGLCQEICPTDWLLAVCHALVYSKCDNLSAQNFCTCFSAVSICIDPLR